ncbi:hypothetical protein N7462_001153 [Penicillium macrosclerotiorum]|uniref:uncharacterized protein n=1 Tax=Penicillium macrosclerotiorum TaxID=303699 RepID=UPI002548CD68|nr:uncharacterized protein N7462_001153 [Penicillium macrosclerotiorum]KAJ5699148.1 hypothetical protein N7462_001153 [Penicillium macrosclerotiorum]
MDNLPLPHTEQHDYQEQQAPQIGKFLAAINGYLPQKLTFTLHLSQAAEEKLFTVVSYTSVFGKQVPVVVYDGSSMKT